MRESRKYFLKKKTEIGNSMFDSKKSHYISVTGIVHKDGKFLIVKRSETEKNSSGKWTVPGGKLTADDYLNAPLIFKKTNQWYNVLPKVLKREVKEEVDLEVDGIKFLTDLIFIRTDGIPTLVVSMYCDYKSGNVKLSKELSDFKWIEADEVPNYDLIEGIDEEIEVVDSILKNKPLPKSFI